MGYVRWLGHAAFEISLDGKRLLIDPWLKGNPCAACKPEDIEHVDIILVTHDHMDHLGDAIKLAKKHDAHFVSIFELSVYASEQGVVKTHGMNIGGTIELEGLKIVMTPALHSATRGAPAGFIVIGKEFSVYHAGDTGLFTEIQEYAKLYGIKVALIPIGGVYTMDPEQAAVFTSFIKPEIAIPMHYNTFPAIRQDPEEYARGVKELCPETKVVILKPGEMVQI